MDNKFLLKLISMIIISTTVMFLLSFNKKVYGSDRGPEYNIVVVENGDTLWTIVKENCSSYKDIRKAIHDVKKINGMTSANIFPGQKIKIPLKLQ